MQENENLIEEEEGEGALSKEERVLGAICYAPFGFVAPVLMQKQSAFLSFHTKQGAIIFLTYLVLTFIPVPLTWGIFTLIYIILAGFAGWRAFEGEMYTYGFIEAILEKFKK